MSRRPRAASCADSPRVDLGRRALTAMQALQWWGVFRLAARCQNLRDAGHPIRSRLVHRQGKKFAEYWMPEEHWL